MWCTRWYLPLVLLPIPIAPPYFLLLFLFSTTMHARPCFYCMVMLTAMFMSTCYWPPVPIETPLVQPWSENVTTYAEALHLLMPNLPEDKTPTTIPVADRCWCDLSNGFFAPFNTTKWEELSVVRLKESLEREIVAEQRAREKEECDIGSGEGVTGPASCEVTEEAPAVSAATPSIRLSFAERLIWNAFQAMRSQPTPQPSVAPSPSPTEESEPSQHAVDEVKVHLENTARPIPTLASPKSTPSPPWLRREYDLRRFGFAMVLDFGWPTPSYT